MGDGGEAFGELPVELFEGGALGREFLLDVVPDELIAVFAGEVVVDGAEGRAWVAMTWRRAVRWLMRLVAFSMVDSSLGRVLGSGIREASRLRPAGDFTGLGLAPQLAEHGRRAPASARAVACTYLSRGARLRR